MASAARVIAHPRVIPAAAVNEVMLEQLEYLIEHTQNGDCGCNLCERYWLARGVLLEMFAESPSP